MSYSGKHRKTVLAVTHSAVKVVAKTVYDRDTFLWNSVISQNLPKTVSMNAFKWLFKIYKVDVKFSLPFCTLFNDVLESQDLMDTTLSFPKSSLFFS